MIQINVPRLINNSIVQTILSIANFPFSFIRNNPGEYMWTHAHFRRTEIKMNEKRLVGELNVTHNERNKNLTPKEKRAALTIKKEQKGLKEIFKFKEYLYAHNMLYLEPSPKDKIKHSFTSPYPLEDLEGALQFINESAQENKELKPEDVEIIHLAITQLCQSFPVLLDLLHKKLNLHFSGIPLVSKPHYDEMTKQMFMVDTLIVKLLKNYAEPGEKSTFPPEKKIFLTFEDYCDLSILSSQLSELNESFIPEDDASNASSCDGGTLYEIQLLNYQLIETLDREIKLKFEDFSSSIIPKIQFIDEVLHDLGFPEESDPESDPHNTKQISRSISFYNPERSFFTDENPVFEKINILGDKIRNILTSNQESINDLILDCSEIYDEIKVDNTDLSDKLQELSHPKFQAVRHDLLDAINNFKHEYYRWYTLRYELQTYFTHQEYEKIGFHLCLLKHEYPDIYLNIEKSMPKNSTLSMLENNFRIESLMHEEHIPFIFDHKKNMAELIEMRKREVEEYKKEENAHPPISYSLLLPKHEVKQLIVF